MRNFLCWSAAPTFVWKLNRGTPDRYVGNAITVTAWPNWNPHESMTGTHTPARHAAPNTLRGLARFFKKQNPRAATDSLTRVTDFGQNRGLYR